jgi:methyl-accepting chemotaxis protein
MHAPSIDNFLQANYRKADRLMLAILWGLFVLALALSAMHDTLRWALFVGLPAALVPTALVVFAGGARLTRLVVAAALMVFCGLHIHQAAGQTELHFGIFVLLAFLLCYRDWTVIVVAAAVVAVHHLAFNYLQEAGFGVRCLVEPGFGMVVVHASYVVAESAVLCYLSVLLHREALQSAELRVSVALLTGGDGGTIDLRSEQRAAVTESGHALQGVVRLLHRSLVRIRDSADSTAQASRQITAGNADLSSRTEQQSAALRDTVHSMAELTAAVKQNADNARQADRLAASASEVAAKGGDVVSQVVQTMEAINASSRRIGDIIAVIDGIAFQTNILALNAAVEAARAGEQGRGFAVVASEVRNLAQRSAGAAKEIKELINESVGQVGAGSALVEQAGRTMDEVVSSVQRVTGIIGQISAASSQQEQGIDQINQAIGAMDGATRHNAAMVAQAVDAATSLEEQAGQLAEVVSVFRLNAGGAALALTR